MFNDILTGKASLESKVESPGPYRELADLPPIRHTCIACGQNYDAAAGSKPARCRPCHIAMVEANARESALAFQAGQDQIRRAERSHWWMRTAIVIAIGIAGTLFRYGMHTQQREDAAQAAGYSSYSAYTKERDAVYPTDDFSDHIHTLSLSMCECQDLACARNIRDQYRRYLSSSSNRASDDKAQASADQDGVRLADCQARFEGP